MFLLMRGIIGYENARMKRERTRSVRLSKDVHATRYNIRLKPDLDTFIFTGEEDISLEIRKSARSITLHAADLDIQKAELRIGPKILTPTISYNEHAETATFSFKERVPKGKGKLTLIFAGILNDTMRGFYRSRYEYMGTTHHLAVTQFESTDARRAFPCFDEPSHKSIFDVTLIVPQDRTAISNTIETEITEHQGGYKAIRFAPSPKMSSYLVAFIVGHFEHIEKKTERGVTVRVFTTPGKKHQSEFALEVAVKCIEFYEKYFGIKYPLPLMDLIAIPDFAVGAMENWGAVTYRETTVLVDPVHSSTMTKQRVALVIAHELAHQWFGNLVTMEWWTHLWLNEGFASYMEYVALHSIFPEWNIWNRFVYEEHARALSLDALKNTHAIEIEVHHPGEISEIFDAVSYSKGAAVIRMLSAYLGEAAFRKGLQLYLKKHQYANAKTEDLWRAFERASRKPVRALMRNWTQKAGYPLVTVSHRKKKTYLSQRRYNASGAVSSNELWMIPLAIKTSSSNSPERVLLSKRVQSLHWKNEGILKVNAGEVTLCRVQYSEEDLIRLGQEIARETGMPEADRLGIIRDAYALSESGHLPTTAYLQLLPAYKNEKSFVVWAQIAEQLHRLNSLYFGTGSYESLRRFGRQALQLAVQDIGWTKVAGEADEQTLLRSVLLYAAGSFGDVKTIQEAQKLFLKLKKGTAHLDPDLRGVVYNLVAQNGGSKVFAELQKMYGVETLEEEKDRILRALCSIKDGKLLTHMLDFAFSEKARGQDSLKAINFVWSNPYGRDHAWTFVQKKWPTITKRFGGGHLFARFILPASSEVSSRRATEIEGFFRKHKTPGIERTTKLVVEQIRSNAAWLKRDERKVERFLHHKAF